MEREKAIEELKHKLTQYVESITEKSPHNSDFICPFCGSGAGTRGTGAFQIAKNTKWEGVKWKCWSCGEEGDIFDLIGKIEGIESFTGRVKRAAELYNIDVDLSAPFNKSTPQDDFKKPEIVEQEPEPQTKVDYTTFFYRTRQNLNQTDYPKKRGLSLEVLNKYNIGYDPDWRHPKAKKTAPTTPRLIIPTSKYSYLARDTREIIPEYQKKFTKAKVGSVHIFNLEEIQKSTRPIFIVEGEIDALSIIEAGGVAIGLGTTSKTKDFLNYLTLERPQKSLILNLDNDNAGEKATEQLTEGLKKLNIRYIKADYLSEFDYNSIDVDGKKTITKVKDPNEALLVNKEKLKQIILNLEQLADMQAQEQAEKEQQEKEQRQQEYKRTSAGAKLPEIRQHINENAFRPKINTGFKNLDEVIGGLYEGLYIIGAISSLGKTTFVLQMVDQIARAGHDVLIFSLEMGTDELISKSISRLSFELACIRGLKSSNAKTSRAILSGGYIEKFNNIELHLIDSCFKEYSKYANNIYILEGVGDIGAKQIRETVQKHIDNTGKIPIVVIDYLQILAPFDVRATDKQNTDKSVMELKRISRDFKTPVIGISSFNRANYSVAVTMEAFKESGAIEYSSDVLIGLQLEGAGEKNFDVIKAKTQTPRKIELVVLKNRNGATGNLIKFDYYPKFNYFV